MTLASPSGEAFRHRGRRSACSCSAANRWSSTPRGVARIRIRLDWRTALDEDRLLILSPFPSTHRRSTVVLAGQHNDLGANLAAKVLIAHAALRSKTETFACKLATSGKPLLTLDSPANANIVEMGEGGRDGEVGRTRPVAYSSGSSAAMRPISRECTMWISQLAKYKLGIQMNDGVYTVLAPTIPLMHKYGT